MFLLDTCVISEGIRPRPDPAVVEWMKYRKPQEFFISVLTLGELHFGVAQLASAAKQRELNDWVSEVGKRFADRIVVFDDVAARQWGYLRASHAATPTTDAQLAATAIAYGFIFVTRNVRHFRFDGLSVINPWDK